MTTSQINRQRGRELAILGGVCLAAGSMLLVFDVWTSGSLSALSHSWLLGFAFFWSIVLGSMFFVLLHYVSGAIWSTVFRRVGEMLMGAQRLLLLAAIPLVIFMVYNDVFALFPWLDKQLVSEHKILTEKSSYLNLGFFCIRMALYFVLWVGVGRIYLKSSLAQDSAAHPGSLTGLRNASGPLMFLFAVSITFASFDWFMSLDPFWFSTIFGIYIFSGMVLSSLSVITLTALYFQKTGITEKNLITSQHLYSLGAYLFAFTCFWAYIAFSQYMLIWYANLPEEAVFFTLRLHGGWLWVSLLLPVLRFFIPFFILISRRAKMNPGLLTLASFIILAGQALDLFWIVMPNVQRFGMLHLTGSLGSVVFFTGLLLVYIRSFSKKHNLLASNDPKFTESREFHL
ncbi:MAG: quinol:cytochrome C oxidoreductase [Fibrobacteria bacterium]|nr:quinol:cytochrome C oxidoreductase [Fibrobacteria bacterium]